MDFLLPTSHTVREESRAWSDLPLDLLTLIAHLLPIVELLRFRTVCKHWLAASSTATAQIESAPGQKPWLLLHVVLSKWLLYKDITQYYHTDMPEIDGDTTFLASNKGWLLLFKQASIFFFCPFSSAKITLPQFPNPDLCDHIAAFSSPPTSPDCVVSVINRAANTNLDLHLLHRGDQNWIKHTLSYDIEQLKTITCASYHNGEFYFLDNADGCLVFSMKSMIGTKYQVVDPKPGRKVDRHLPFSSIPNYFAVKEMKNIFGTGQNVSVTICGTVIEKYPNHQQFIRNENIQHSGGGTTPIVTKGVWIFPHLFRVPHNQRW